MRLHVPIKLRWSDLDAYGHVNNATWVRLLEQIRIEAFWALDGEEPVGVAIIDATPESQTLSLIGHQEIEYLVPAPYLRDPLDAEVWVGKLGGASMQVCYELYTPAGVEPRILFTKAETTLVLVDAATMKPRRMTSDERAAWTPYLEAPVVFRH